MENYLYYSDPFFAYNNALYIEKTINGKPVNIKLSNFLARITEDITCTNGAENERFLSIVGTDEKGKDLNKLIQYQYSVYNDRSSADFPLLFDTAIADALVLGPLRAEEVVLPDEILQKIKAYGVNAKTERLMITLAEYYIANKEPDSDWVIIPRTNISAYLGSATYMEAYESRIPEGFMDKKAEMGGVSAVRINL